MKKRLYKLFITFITIIIGLIVCFLIAINTGILKDVTSYMRDNNFIAAYELSASSQNRVLKVNAIAYLHQDASKELGDNYTLTKAWYSLENNGRAILHYTHKNNNHENIYLAYVWDSIINDFILWDTTDNTNYVLIDSIISDENKLIATQHNAIVNTIYKLKSEYNSKLDKDDLVLISSLKDEVTLLDIDRQMN